MVLAADTCVISEGKIFGKPNSPADAQRMLTALSGRTHAVMTGVAAVTPSHTVSDVEITQVTFDLISEEEIIRYIASGEPLDKAGAYAIQGICRPAGSRASKAITSTLWASRSQGSSAFSPRLRSPLSRGCHPRRWEPWPDL